MANFSVEERHDRAISTYIGMTAMKAVGLETLLFGPRFLRSAKLNEPQPVGSPELTIPHSRMLGCTVEHRLVHDFHVYDITPGSQAVAATGQKKKLIFYAGGGFQSPASGGHWQFCAELSNKIPNTSTILVSYPLSPNNTADKVYADIQKVYLTLLAEAKAKNEFIILGGDSAGGNLSIGLPTSTLKADPSAAHPDVILTISPAVETSHTNPDILKVEPFDPMLTKAYCENASVKWRGAWPTEDPRLSVLFADLSPLVEKKIHLIGTIGGYDVLSPDELLFMEKTKTSGVSAEWLVWDKQMHCFPIAFSFGFPEAVAGKDWIIEKLIKQRA